MSGRQLFSQEAEQSVLGALLLDNAALDRIDDRLKTDDFYVGAHRTIYAAIRGLIIDGKKADAVSLANALRGSIEDVGGLEYIGALLEAVPSATNAEHYAGIVRERSLERQLAAAAAEIAEIARGREPIAERMDRAQSLVMAITEEVAIGEPRQIGGLLKEFVTEIEARQERGGQLVGLSTTIGDLDRKLGGLHAGQLVVVAGRPSMGKSSLALQIADHAAVAGGSALVFSLEMGAGELTEKTVANVGKANLAALRDGQLRDEDWERINTAIGKLHEAKLIIDDSVGLSVEQMRARARRVKRQHGLNLIVVDYLQLMDAPGDNRVEVIGSITRGLKKLAKELSVPVIALSQLNRKCEERTNKRPVMSDLRESGNVEQDADVIVFIYRDEVYNSDSKDKGIAELIIAKQRMGAIGTVGATFIGQYGFFGDTDWVPRNREQHQDTRKATYADDF